jgi:hypothetical protein
MRCPLCTDDFDDATKFCGTCYKRAEESIDRRDRSITEAEQAVEVSLTYLSFLYAGIRPLTVTKEAELAALSVTVAHDIRHYRTMIEDLEDQLRQLRQPNLNVPDLATLHLKFGISG